MSEPLFALGQLMMTEDAEDMFLSSDMDVRALLKRHVTGDWGDLDSHDVNVNNEAVKHGRRILSQYRTSEGKIWVITESDRSVTTILLPDEY